MEPKVEILAPAGSYESMIAAMNAGADAIYMGGGRFGARAYADNPEEDRYLEAIDEVHLRGCKLYMTVNTLVKDEELSELFAYLNPYYEWGLDAVIVQDLGVLSFVREHFPDLPVHASTQMTITGVHGARMLKEMGATRIVTARELSLEEIAKIRDHVDVEIESFVHGALCYCYSGQCLLSSFIGGRSGNRGRCAQPCRLPYEVRKDGKILNTKENAYVLSPKDLCSLDIIPDIIEAGVYSLKIEGRMKSPRYTAGVVSTYRKYVDRYLEYGRAGYRVDENDKRRLLDLFDRGGFTDGYYQQHNGRNMIALKEKPAFREGNQALFDELDQEYVTKHHQQAIQGSVMLTEGQPACLRLKWGMIETEVFGEIVQTAKNQPLTKERLLKQMKKTGNTAFYFESLEASLSGDCFLPLQALNELRRTGLESLVEKRLQPYRRQNQAMVCGEREMMSLVKPSDGIRLHVSLEVPETFDCVVSKPAVQAIYLDSTGFDAHTWQPLAARCHKAGKECVLVMPHIFRKDAEQYFCKHRNLFVNAGFDAVLIRSLEEVDFLKEQQIEIPKIFDYNMYTMNTNAGMKMTELGAKRLTLPLELNSRELAALGCQAMELIGYGYLPAMVSAQCVAATTGGCRKVSQQLYLKDRMKKELLVKNHCRFCYNTIYNSAPLSLQGQGDLIRRLKPGVLRLQFTVEEPEQVGELIDAYTAEFLDGEPGQAPKTEFTRGHLKRGVE